MVCLSKTYSPAIYESLGEVEVVSTLVSKEDIHNVGKIVLNYGYEESVTVLIAHKHFDLHPNEAMYEYNIVHEKFGQVNLTKPYDIEEIEKRQAQPNILAIGKDRIWYPVNYSNEYSEVEAWKNDKFLSEIAVYLFENGLENKLMLGAREKYLKFGRGSNTMERNCEKTRTSQITLMTGDEDEKDAIRVAYTFSEDKNGVVVNEEGSCGSHCNHSCNHTCVICW